MMDQRDDIYYPETKRTNELIKRKTNRRRPHYSGNNILPSEKLILILD